MPLINGMKMACEPCIRGHRSTKCTHANERLMMPVRKPGRPLSACPHPRDQTCGCGTVTAAIPRTQTCHCGGDIPAQGPAPQVITKTIEAALQTEVPLPTKASFKVQKPSRPPSSRKQSFDPANFERVDMSNVNVIPFEKRPQMMPIAIPNGYTMAGAPQMYGYAPQYTNVQSHYDHIPMQPQPYAHGLDMPTPFPSGMNEFSTCLPSNGLDQVVESPLATPKIGNNNSDNDTNAGISCCASKTSPKVVDEAEKTTNGGSCCEPKQNGNSHNLTSTSIPESQESVIASCCLSNSSQHVLKQKSVVSNGTPANLTPQMPHQILPQAGITFNPGLYPQLLPQTTVFTYPPTYGSFQNPLQPYAWRQTMRANNYGLPQAQVPLPPRPLPFDSPIVPGTMDTIHTCHCGDTCQCIGCAAHPYNDATQDYVRSAWSSISSEQHPSEQYNNGHTLANGNGNGVLPQPPQNSKNGDPMSSPAAHTPSSTTSGNGEEQSLSESDFFFVNYSYTSESCGGDMQSCPCGDECQCLGCTIHTQPSMPCGGEKDTCPCGENCECVGCTIHNGNTAV